MRRADLVLIFLLFSGLSTHAQPAYLGFDFNGTSDGEWTPIAGNWSVSGGKYRQTLTNGLAMTTLPYTYSDVSAQLTVQLVSPAADAWAGLAFFGASQTAQQKGMWLVLTANGTMDIRKNGQRISSSEPFATPTSPLTYYWEFVGPKSITRLPGILPGIDINGWDCDARNESGLVQLVTYNCAAIFDDVGVWNRGPAPAYTPRPEATPKALAERSFYCPAATTGAGGSLLKFWTAGALADRISNFAQLPDLLADARRTGSNIVYLVDWWDGGYSNKGDYLPSTTLGGATAFRDGIAALHAQGGKIVLYIEPFIVHRTRSAVGRNYGAAWGMMDNAQRYYGYYGDNDFYLMWPGAGAGWTQYLSDLCGALARDYAIDGVFLDSYGIQWGWIDYHPNHTGGTTGTAFNQGVLDLIRQTRNKMRQHVPAAVVWVEGSEQEQVLQEVSGSQIESLDLYSRKPWRDANLYQVFIAEYDLRAMQRILAVGASLACNDFFFSDVPSDSTLDKIRAGVQKQGGRELQQQMWKMVNVAYANGIVPPEGLRDPSDIDCDIQIAQYHNESGRVPIPGLPELVDYYRPRLVALRTVPHRLPADALREWLSATLAPAVLSIQ